MKSLLLLLLCAACAGPVRSVDHLRSNIAPAAVIEGSAPARPPQPQSLPVPARVALAFVPEMGSGAGPASVTRPASWSDGPLPEAFKTQVLDELAEAFRGGDLVGDIEVIPSFYLSGATAEEIVAGMASTFDVDAVVLVTYDLQHFWRENGWAFTYLLLVPVLFVPGNEVDSQLLLDTAVYWSENGALLFRASSTVTGHGTFPPPYLDKTVQAVTEDCFAAARGALVPKLRAELADFAQRVQGVAREP